ncbi:hypothetical protein [Sinomicrobium sp. M5D2P17]
MIKSISQFFVPLLFSVTIWGQAQTENRNLDQNLFKTDPEKYAPQYRGWCACAMGDSGEKVSVDPEILKILDGRLYLFYHTFFSNTLTI